MAKYNKCYEPSDYFNEMAHIEGVRRALANVTHRFEHPNRKWEYGLALNILRDREVRAVLDVGGGGSIFAPAAVWPGLGVELVLQVDPGDVGSWVSGQENALRRLRPDFTGLMDIIQEDFLKWDGGEYAPFDAVTCLSVIEHVPSNREEEFFLKLLSHVDKGGLLVLTTDFHPSGKAMTGGHFRTYNKSSLNSLVNWARKKDFKPVDTPDWSYEGQHVYDYNFAAMVLEKTK